MADIRKLLNHLAAQEAQLHNTQFLAPCVRGGLVCTRVSGIIYTFTSEPRDFEGWGIFQPVNDKIAQMVEEPSLPQIAKYLRNLKSLRFRLVRILRRQTWLAYPVNESDMQQRWGMTTPVPLHLVTEGTTFEECVACWDGSAWWFDELDRRADPLVGEQLREALKKLTSPEELRFLGMTREMRTAYNLAVQPVLEYQSQMQHRRDENRLHKALQMGGGRLAEFRDRGEFWQIEWTTSNGERHTSAISKNDLTVVSAGICLSGCDRDFDLQSLVGVVEGRE